MSTPISKKLAKKPALTASGSRTLGQKVAALNRWREQYNPLQGLTLRRAVSLASDYFRGNMADLQWAYFFIEQTDPDLMALLDHRLGRLCEMDYNISTEEDADEKLAQDQSDCLEAKFSAIDNLYQSIEHLGTDKFRGFAHCEKWFTNGELTHLEIVDQWNVVRDGLVGGWKYNPEARSANYNALGEEAIMLPENFLISEVRRPINRIALYKFVRDNLCNVDWDAFNAIFGIPSGVVTGPADVPEDKEAEFETAANQIAEGGSGYLPFGATYTQNRAPGGTNPFRDRLEYLSERLILAGTGGKLTMLTEAGSGTLAGGAHSDVFDSIVRGDARRISELLNRQLTGAWLDEAFPGQPHVAYFGLAANEEMDVSKIAADIKLLNDAGFEIDEKEASAKTGYTLKRKAAPVPVVGPALVDAPSGQPDPAAAEKIANRARAAGKDAIMKANAAAQELAARRVVFGPIANRLAAIVAIEDPAQRAAAVSAFRADSGRLYAEVMAKAPDLAKPAEEAIGTALISGFVEAAQARSERGQNKAPVSKTAPSTRVKAATGRHARLKAP